ncbi:MAG: sigma-70 family RNA polymerase sigma factor [Acidobacteria bacterium]|nr:sigma-70 family RNA polymerase sigma factor [Acidobacteriota bacterium]
MTTPQFTDLLAAWRAGDRQAFDQLAALVDAELRRLARHYLRGERNGHTLQTTGLVNEAWMRLLESGQVNWENRAHFIAAAATTMRHVLVDWARTYQYQKRGGGAVQVSLGEAMLVEPERSTELVAIHEALERLAEFNANAACVVEWRFFGGFQNKEIAEAMGISEASAVRYWHFAQAWLKRELTR